MSDIDQVRLRRAIKKAQNKPKLSWNDIPQAQKDAMRRRFSNGDILSKLKMIFQMVSDGKTPPDRIVQEIIDMILG